MVTAAYGAGWRAGMAERPLVCHADGTKTLAQPDCPFPPRRFISRALWFTGYHDGTMRSINTWLKGRKNV